jgi:hypothetical protein
VIRTAFAVVACLFACGVVAAQPPRLPPPPKGKDAAPAKADPKKADPKKADAKKDEKPEAKTDPKEAEAVAKMLRDLVQKNLPDPLTKGSEKWGHQETLMVRYREGFLKWSAPVEEKRNDGLWRRFDVRIPDPKGIKLEVTELTHPEPERTDITITSTCERVDIHFEHQLWRNGRRLYAGETRAHCKAGIVLKAEVVTKTEFKKGELIPEVTIKFKATEAKLSYENVVVEKTAGIDGPAAALLGDLVLKTIKAVTPDLEKDLLEKANAAIVKAAGEREFKVTLGKVTEVKPKK